MWQELKRFFRDKNIIQSLLDLDFYKLTTGQMVFKKYADVPVKFAFNCRTKIRLADFIKEQDLREQLDHVQRLKLSDAEVDYLRRLKDGSGQRRFAEDYILFLKNLQLPDYYLEVVDGNFVLEFSGPWEKVTYWETIALSIVNELYYRSLMGSTPVLYNTR